MTVFAPLYLLESWAECWKCGRSQRVIALAAAYVSEDGEEDGEKNEPESEEAAEEFEPYVLSNITQMPDEVYAHISAVNPRYVLNHSRTAGQTYFANLCECGANFGDFYLFDEPGGAFFPMSDEDAAQIVIRKLPFEGQFPFECDYGLGTGGQIFKHGKHE